MYPYLSATDFVRRTLMPAVDVAYVRTSVPGFLEQRISTWSSFINGRFRKRYGNSQGPGGNSLPLGRVAPLFTSFGTNPPGLSLVGVPASGSQLISVRIATPGVLGTATFDWSIDGGATWPNLGVTTAASVALPSTGLSVAFSPGTYSADNVYNADPAVPEIVLGWLTTLVTNDMYRKRGRDPADAAMVDLKEEVAAVFADIKEAADSDTGLFDIPVTEQADSAVTTGGPLGYAEQSPYTWADLERCSGQSEDAQNLDLRDNLNGARIV